MASNHIVDLLSSDDEASNALPCPLPRKSSLSNNPNYLDNDFDSPLRLPSFPIERSSKRRKLSPALSSEDDGQLRLSPRAQVSAPTGTSKSFDVKNTGNCNTLDEEDPIIFTSSIPVREARAHIHAGKTIAFRADGYESDESLPDEIVPASSRFQDPALSSRTAAILEGLSQAPKHPKPTAARKRSGDPGKATRAVLSPSGAGDKDASGVENQPTASQSTSKPARKAKLTEEEKAEMMREKEKQKAAKAREKENAKAVSKEQKAKEKEEEKEKKRLQKEEQARQKKQAAERAEVNKLRLDRKETALEMIVDLPASIDGQTVDTQVKEIFKDANITSTLYQSPIPNVIKWRRKTKARWNEEEDCFEPLQRMEIHDEIHVMCLMSAKEFVDLALMQNDGEDVETHIAKMKSSFPACTPIYLIEGLSALIAKSKNAENRAYQAKVHSLAQGEAGLSSSQQASKSKKKTAEIVDEDVIEDALLRLQVMNKCLIHHTHIPKETAEWIAIFTMNISQIPYR